MKVLLFFCFFFYCHTNTCVLLLFFKVHWGQKQCGACVCEHRTRAALRLREQLAAPSNIHERDGKTVKDSVDPGMQKREAETGSVSSQRLMGLICINSEPLLFLRDIVCCVRGGSRWAAIEFLSPVTLLFCSGQSAAAARFNIAERQWPALQCCTAAGSMFPRLSSVCWWENHTPKYKHEHL